MFVCMCFSVYAMDDELNMYNNNYCNSFDAIIFAVELKKVKEKKKLLILSSLLSLSLSVMFHYPEIVHCSVVMRV